MRKVTPRIFSLLALVLVLSGSAWAEGGYLIEKRKTIVKVFEVSTKDHLLVDNQYGHVKVHLWDKKEIRVEVVITANASTDERALSYLRSVLIEERREGGQIILRTSIDRAAYGTSSWNAWKSTKDDKNAIQIDYTVTMPKENALSIRNRFGDTTIPAFLAPLSVESRYGNFYATKLQNESNILQIVDGDINIGEVVGGKFNVRNCNLQLDRAGALQLINKLGNLCIKDVNVLNANIDYAEAKIGTLRESGIIRLSFSDGFSIGQLPQTAANVDIRATYSPVVLPAESSQFNVTVSHGNFSYPEGVKVNFISPPAVRGSQPTPATRQYEGQVGNGTGTRIKVVSTYGNVRLKE